MAQMTRRSSGPLESTRCPACGGMSLRSFGTPRVIDSGIVESRPTTVCRCQDCDLLFFVPVQSVSALSDQYSKLAEDLWTGEDRPDWTLARGEVVRHGSAGRVLDVGCWTGRFLHSLPPQYEKWGIEPSQWARARAAAGGVMFAGDSLEQIASHRAEFDVITMIDVIEHTTEPLEALVLAASGLRDGGILAIATGDSRALPWRLMPRDYWYYFSEHVCFFSERWFRWAASRADLRIEAITRFSRYPTNSTTMPHLELATAYVYRLMGGSRSRPARFAGRAPWLRQHLDTHHWRDHILVVFRKSSDTGLHKGS